MNQPVREERVNVLMDLSPSDYKRIAIDFVVLADEVADPATSTSLLRRAQVYATIYQTETTKALELR